MNSVSGRFYRIIYARDLGRVLDPVPSIEGRFHHAGQSALYMSPQAKTAGLAIDSYVQPGDPERLIVPLLLSAADILDFRIPETNRDLGLSGKETCANWRQQRSADQPAESWKASDAARDLGANGMIYPSRKYRPLWHIVLFRWNQPDAPALREDGPTLPFDPEQLP